VGGGEEKMTEWKEGVGGEKASRLGLEGVSGVEGCVEEK